MAEVERVQTLGQYVAVLRRRWPILAIVIPSAILISVAIAFLTPPLYKSTATILLEASSIDPALVKTTVVSYADQQIELVQRTVMTNERLEEIVKKIDPYPDLTNLTVQQKADQVIADTSIQKVDPITLEPVPESSAFQISYFNPSPSLAKQITGEIAQLFLTYNLETRTAQARDAYNFLLVTSKSLEKHILDLEQKISDFKIRYGDALPEAQTRNENSLDRVQRDVDATDAQVRVVEQQEALLQLQLSQISPTLIADKGGDIYTQLGTLRAQLAEAQQKYTPDHPDVKRLTRAIQTLADQAKLGNPQNVRPDNPEYLRVFSELNAVRTNLAALRSSAARARAQIADYERRLALTPGVERDYSQLERDREIAQQQYSETQTKLREAEISKTLESQAKGERYTLIRKPVTPGSPDSPNRLGIILLGLVIGGGLAAGVAAFRESADPTVRTSLDITDIADLPLVGAVPSMFNATERHRRRVVWGGVSGVYAFATLVLVILISQSS